jgi:hypothetical protein
VKQLVQNTAFNPEGYVWYQMGFFALQNAAGRTTVLCFDTPDRFRLQLLEDLNSSSRGFKEPDIHQLHTFLVEQILNLYDESVWALRDIVREVEKVSGVDVEEVSRIIIQLLGTIRSTSHRAQLPFSSRYRKTCNPCI